MDISLLFRTEREFPGLFFSHPNEYILHKKMNASARHTCGS